MKRYIDLNTRQIEYTLEYKKVKNINLRIKHDGIFVSANKRVSIKRIEEFMRDKSEFIIRAIDKFASMPKKEKVQYQYPETLLCAIWGKLSYEEIGANCDIETAKERLEITAPLPKDMENVLNKFNFV